MRRFPHKRWGMPPRPQLPLHPPSETGICLGRGELTVRGGGRGCRSKEHKSIIHVDHPERNRFKLLALWSERWGAILLGKIIEDEGMKSPGTRSGGALHDKKIWPRKRREGRVRRMGGSRVWPSGAVTCPGITSNQYCWEWQH